MVALGATKRGMTCSEVAAATRGSVVSIFGVLKRLVKDGQVAKDGRTYRAAKAAKEAP